MLFNTVRLPFCDMSFQVAANSTHYYFFAIETNCQVRHIFLVLSGCELFKFVGLVVNVVS